MRSVQPMAAGRSRVESRVLASEEHDLVPIMYIMSSKHYRSRCMTGHPVAPVPRNRGYRRSRSSPVRSEVHLSGDTAMPRA
jgi:hypothetical protein